jgi:hypothetical protein
VTNDCSFSSSFGTKATAAAAAAAVEAGAVKILSRISVGGISVVSVCRRRRRAVVNGSLNLAARATVLQAFLFD